MTVSGAIRAKHRARALQALASHRCATDLTDGFCGPRDGECFGECHGRNCVRQAEGLLQALETVGCIVVWEHDPSLAPIKEIVDTLTAASHALKSYAFGNVSFGLAKSIAKRVDATLAKVEGAS